MNYRMKVQYDGTRYQGWQRQSGSSATIQGKIEEVLTRQAGRPVRIDGAGRTDAGVHAIEQIANVHLPESFAVSPDELRTVLNEYLPEDIRILHMERAGERFHSRLHATGKQYRYHLMKWDSEQVFLRKYSWKMTEALDIPSMQEAAGHLLGEHDFKSFCTKASKKKTTVRQLTQIQIEETEHEVLLTFEGSGFLYNMVRILTGTLVEVGTGSRRPDEIPEILERKERKYAGETAPAKGLFLVKVYYD